MGRNGGQKLDFTVYRLLDNYPGILGISDDTLGLLNGTLSMAVDVIHSIEGDIKTMNLSGPTHYLYQTESLGINAQELCLDMMGELVNLVSGCAVSDIAAHIIPGVDEEKLVYTFRSKNLAEHSYAFKDEVEDVVNNYTKVYRNGKNGNTVECDGKSDDRRGQGICYSFV